MHFLGIDLGTSAIKALLVDAEQHVCGTASVSLTVQRPHPGWSEQDPRDWIQCLELVMDELTTKYPAEVSAVKAIGLSGHMHGATLLDKKDEVLRPCILWNDTRSHEQAARLDQHPLFRATTGNIVFPGFTAPKLLWVKENEPTLFDAIHKVLLPKDYVRLWLTGETVSDMSDASGTAWLDVANRCWSEELLAATDLGLPHMPRLVEGTQASGQLRPMLAERWAMTSNVIVAGGAGDNAATACAMGVVEDACAFVSLGTSGVVFSATDAYRPNAESAIHTFCHAYPDTWHQMGVILSATDCLNWLAGLLNRTPAELTAALGDKLRAPSGLTFLPYLAGERTPHNDANIRGAFVGLSLDSDQTLLTQSVIEGVSFALRDCVDALNDAGTTLDRVWAVGGGSQSAYWLELIAAVLNIPIDVPAFGELGAAGGAARLAMAAADCQLHNVFAQPALLKTIEPNLSLTQAYTEAYLAYRALYPKLRLT